MYQATYPKLQEEVTSERFAGNGIESHQANKEVERELRLSGFTNTLKTSEERLMEEETAIGQTWKLIRILGKMNGEYGTGRASKLTHGRGRGRRLGRGQYFRNQIKQELCEWFRADFKYKTMPDKTGRDTKRQANSAQGKAAESDGKILLAASRTPHFSKNRALHTPT